MKQLILILTSIFVFAQAQAGAELEASMKIIGEQFKIIATAIQTQTLGEDQLTAVDVMQKEIATSTQFFPDNATTEAQQLEYTTMMNDLQMLAQDLEALMKEALGKEPLDLTAVTQKFIEINELRKKGHDLFKE